MQVIIIVEKMILSLYLQMSKCGLNKSKLKQTISSLVRWLTIKTANIINDPLNKTSTGNL
jgi:hypothetical protein